MAVQVTQPNRQQATYSNSHNQLSSNLSKVGMVGGAIIGGIVGNGPGALAGASAGGSLGNMVGGMFGGGDTQEVKQPPPQAELVDAAPSDAMQRRMNQIKTSDLSNIREGIDSLKYIKDDETRIALAKPLLKAEYMAKG